MNIFKHRWSRMNTKSYNEKLYLFSLSMKDWQIINLWLLYKKCEYEEQIKSHLLYFFGFYYSYIERILMVVSIYFSMCLLALIWKEQCCSSWNSKTALVLISPEILLLSFSCIFEKLMEQFRLYIHWILIYATYLQKHQLANDKSFSLYCNRKEFHRLLRHRL